MTASYASLTSLASCGGCAAKLAPDHLSRIVAGLGLQLDDENLLVGLSRADDAAVYRLNDEQALIFTTDFFPPLVDDPYLYGAIAATNAMSDVFAMGGTVLLALNIAAFPEDMPTEIATAIFQGGADKVREAGGVVAGGHTIRDQEPKYGMAVAGLVHPERVTLKGAAKVGDKLLLTKPLGAGVTITGRRMGLVSDQELAEATEWMTTLNGRSSKLFVDAGVTALTDVTGFGLIGHSLEMADASGTCFVYDGAAVPLQSAAIRMAAEDVRTSGDARNRRSAGDRVRIHPEAAPHLDVLLHDPQTSGGLLAAAAPAVATEVLANARDQGIPMWEIGEVIAGSGVEIRP
ncbi:MAG: selenide, water dikinase SelD [Dehalococcoidia bacterium]